MSSSGGTALDTVNPYRGGSEQRWSESVESAVHHWAVASNYAPPPQHRDHSDGISSARETCYIDATGFARVRLITVADGTHSWPGTTDADHIAQFGPPGTFIASQPHWDFVQEVEQLRT